MFYYKPWGDGFSVVTATFTVELGPGIFKLFIISYICFILWIHVTSYLGEINKHIHQVPPK
jgi:hypothetical protein